MERFLIGINVLAGNMAQPGAVSGGVGGRWYSKQRGGWGGADGYITQQI